MVHVVIIFGTGNYFFSLLVFIYLRLGRAFRVRLVRCIRLKGRLAVREVKVGRSRGRAEIYWMYVGMQFACNARVSEREREGWDASRRGHGFLAPFSLRGPMHPFFGL